MTEIKKFKESNFFDYDILIIMESKLNTRRFKYNKYVEED